jgi:hypothetical protein
MVEVFGRFPVMETFKSDGWTYGRIVIVESIFINKEQAKRWTNHNFPSTKGS